MSGHLARSGPRTVIGLLAALGLVAALAMPALAGEEHPLVTPEVINDTANRECDFFEGEGQTWTTLKVDPNPNGAGPHVYTQGSVTITITNAENDKTFDWSSNVGIDAVYVKAGAGGSHLYRYDPPTEVMADENLTSPGDSGNGISHISFCYDAEAGSTPTPTPTPTPTEEPSEEETASPTPTEEPSEEETASPTPTERGDVLGGNPTPTPGGSLPDTAMGEWGQVPATVLSLLLLGSLAAMVYVRLARQR